ncbi:MAG: sarcosine oxidase subunit gamma family protein [Roseiarcus sp.]|uniref:sarcosine oxidase subunit gamma n=1 Tax=Roseiarcus sp. TaxID=1969460 RepID=UPI003C49E1BE
MSDAVLIPRSPLEGLALPAGDRFAVAEAPAAARLVFRGGEAARAACSAAFGAELPARLGLASARENRAALWLGPDEWLLIAGGADADLLGAELEAAFDAAPHSLVDVSHRQIGLLVSGQIAVRALSAGCPLDLHLSAFPVGTATRTIFDKAEIVLWRLGATAFHVEVWRSFAPYLVVALTEAARGAPGW